MIYIFPRCDTHKVLFERDFVICQGPTIKPSLWVGWSIFDINNFGNEINNLFTSITLLYIHVINFDILSSPRTRVEINYLSAKKIPAG